ncbi:MAG: two-component sensor histidine kinase [Desulfovibrio sp.]|nr:two-component sensor histidine kinase [Desulfovibrio sp.]
MLDALVNGFKRLWEVSDDVSPQRYRALGRLLSSLMIVVSVAPLLVLSWINYNQYQDSMAREIEVPLRDVVQRTRTALEVLLGERLSTVSLISEAYSFEKLASDGDLARIFHAMRSEFDGFVDLGLINEEGRQVAYVGPYELKNVDYSDQPWWREVQVHRKVVSDILSGARGTPHLVLAVGHLGEGGRSWVLKATIETRQLDRLLATVGQSGETDIFLVNRERILQTASANFGGLFKKCPLELPQASWNIAAGRVAAPDGSRFAAAYASVPDTNLMLVAVKPEADFMKPLSALQTDILLVLAVGVALIFVMTVVPMKLLMKRLQASDERRVAVFAQMEHTQKLSSIGRLAAGVAHEVNNPLAIINEKSGLALDYINAAGDFPRKERVAELIGSIGQAVDRARGITHRLLGFSRRMEANMQQMQLAEVIEETISFVERDAQRRGVALTASLDRGLPEVTSDRGQLQQVFLNLVGNAVQATAEGGRVEVTLRGLDKDFAEVAVADTGCGMSAEVVSHIFEPFYTTKKENGHGLGLFITYGIVRRLGGEISVESEEGKGTAFRVAIPYVKPEKQA